MMDISGPSASISSQTTSNYQYAMVVTTGELTVNGISGQGNRGDVYVNCPGTPDGIIAPQEAFTGNYGDHIDVGLEFTSMYAHSTTQEGFWRDNPNGELIRVLGHSLSRYRNASPFWNTRTTPDNQAIWSPVYGEDGWRKTEIVQFVPPFDTYDSINGGDFVYQTIQISTPPISSDNVIVEFGYPDYGSDGLTKFYCTSRSENCVMGNTTISDPYTYASETNSGQACAGGCTVKVPALSGRVMYYRVKYRTGTSVNLAGPTSTAAIP